jgi:acetylornithine deacetylase/succinyl-diaminopimelate desuccinylase-like protein
MDWKQIENEALEIFCKLLTFDTTNPPGNEKPAIDYVRGLLESSGLTPVVVGAEEQRPNLVARIPGKGTGPSLMLDSHIDVVPANEGNWTVPPFSGEIRDGWVWGRGAIDMKHMTAMSVSVMLNAARTGFSPSGDLVLSVTSDEETGAGLGAFYLVENHPDLIRADYALGEVGGMNITMNGHRIFPVQVAEKGICWLTLKVSGEAGHGSVHRKNTVPERVGQVLKRLSSLSFPSAPHPAARAFIEALAQCSSFPNAQVLRMLARGVGTNTLLGKVVPEERAAPLRAILGHTAQPTVVSCGSKINVVPSEGTILMDCRVLPGTSPDEMRGMVAGHLGDLATVEMTKGLRGSAVSIDNPLYKTIEAVVAEMDPGSRVCPYLMPGFTNGGAYTQLGTKYMGFTPVLMPPTVEFSSLFHTVDERLPVDGFKWGVRTLWEIVARFLG